MKKIILFCTSIILITVLACNKLEENKDNDVEVIEFQLIDFQSREPVENEMIYLTTPQKYSCTPLPITIDSISIDDKGHFSIPKNVFNGDSFSFYLKKENKKNLRGISSIQHSTKTDKLRIYSYLDGFGSLNGVSNYDLKSKEMSYHNIYDGDTISKTYERVDLFLYSKSRYSEMREKLDSLLMTNKDIKKVLNEIWDFYYQVATNSLQQVDRTFEEIDILLRLTSNLQYFIDSKQETVDLNAVFEIIDESKDIRKKYNFLYFACEQINDNIFQNKPIDNHQIKKLLNKIDDFTLKNSKFINNKIEHYSHGKSIGVDCHPLQREKGELLMRLDKDSDKGPNVRDCCNLGK